MRSRVEVHVVADILEGTFVAEGSIGQEVPDSSPVMVVDNSPGTALPRDIAVELEDILVHVG